MLKMMIRMKKHPKSLRPEKRRWRKIWTFKIVAPVF